MSTKAKTAAKAKSAAKRPAKKPVKTVAAKKSGGRNPLVGRWTTPFAIPPFEDIKTKHFLSAIDKGFAANVKEIAAIADNSTAPTFANTIDALEKSGELLDRVSAVFFSLTGTDTTPEMQAIEREVAPRYARHSMAVYQNAKLFKRVDTLMRDVKKLGLTLEQTRVLERYHRGFVKAGANLDTKAKKRLAAIAERGASLGTQFGQNVLADEQDWVLFLEEADLVGLPPAVQAAAAQTATDRGKPGKHAITLLRSSIEPFLQYSARRDLREKAWKAWKARGANGGKTDNRAIVREILGLRAERAKLLGYKSAADSSLEFSMAKTPTAVRNLLMDVWAPARKRALEERDLLQQAVQAEGSNFKLAAWDWLYYAEKVRKAKFDVDEAEIKPYLQLDSMIQAAFEVAGKLFGVSFKEREDLALHHADARVFEVLDKAGKHIGLFVGDYFARPSKYSGAWMRSWRQQHSLGHVTTPIVINVMNFAKARPGEPSLLSFDDARTLFHEFGHALHGLLSNVTYPTVSGTSVERDFVELPSQLYEHWLERPEVLRKFARHYKTDRPVPEALLKRIKAARTFNQGFGTVEYLSAAIVDIDLHVLESADKLDVDKFEAETLARIGMPKEITMRHRIPHFQHIIGGYAAGYYSYMWSEVMDSDAFRAFEETGDVFDPETARRLRDFIYSAGGKQDPADAYIAFRGRLPDIQPLLDKKGFSKPIAA